MKYRLIYLYTTRNYHVYICESRNPEKDGLKFYLPRLNTVNRALEKTDVIISDPPKNPSPPFAKLVYRDENLDTPEYGE